MRRNPWDGAASKPAFMPTLTPTGSLMNVLRKWSKPSPPALCVNMEQFRSLCARSSPYLLLPPSTTKRSTTSSTNDGAKASAPTPAAKLPTFAPSPLSFAMPVLAASLDPNDPPRDSPLTLSAGETESEPGLGDPTRAVPRPRRALEPIPIGS